MASRNIRRATPTRWAVRALTWAGTAGMIVAAGGALATPAFAAGDVPSVTINQAAAQSDPTSTGPIAFDVVFSEPVEAFIPSGVSFAGSTVRKITRGMWAIDQLNDTLMLALLPSAFVLVATTALLAVQWPLMGALIAISSIWALFLLAYRYLPARKTPWRTAVVAATFSALAHELLKLAFSTYVTELANYTSTLGNLATAAVLLLWIYYGALVFIVGGEVAHVYTMLRARRAAVSQQS